MFRTEQTEFLADETKYEPAAFARPLASPMWERSDYHPSGRFNLVAAAGSAASVALLLSGLLWLNVTAPRTPHRELVMVDLAVTPPPPPPPRKLVTPQKPHNVEQKPAPAVTPVADPAPVPIVTVPLPVTPTPAPVVAQVAAPAAAPPAPPAAAPADAGDLSSKMISAKPPAYPLESRRRHEQGVVILTILLSPEGRVADIAVAQSSGSDRLDQAALAAVRNWRWSPIVRGGEPVAVQGRVRIPFILTH